MTLFTWQAGKALGWDVTCVDIIAMSYINGSIMAAGSAAETTEKKKVDKYKKLVDGRYIFGPLALRLLEHGDQHAKTFSVPLGERLLTRLGRKVF
jgi:hypothetical protein